MFNKKYSVYFIQEQTATNRVMDVKAASKKEVVDCAKDYIGIWKFEKANMYWISKKELVVWY